MRGPTVVVLKLTAHRRPTALDRRPRTKRRPLVLQALEDSESTLERWRLQYGGMKAEEAKRLKIHRETT
jgi:hypothetical protein